MIRLRVIGWLLIVIVLTVLTQIGGVIFLLCLPIFYRIKKKYRKRKFLINLSIFSGLYLITTFLVVPILAKPFGRVPLPVIGNKSVKPLNIMTCIFNRHYVQPELKISIENSARKMNQKFPGSITSYLDANFPFYNGFPLLPHLSHNDGKKIDLAFFYIDKTGKQVNHSAPSFIGYGVFEEPKSNEQQMPSICEEKGFWQYSFLGKVVPQWNKDEMIFDQQRTKYFIQLLLNEGSTSKIFIEPHLKSRMGINSNKVRFHGCRAVRHDDHIHLQMK